MPPLARRLALSLLLPLAACASGSPMPDAALAPEAPLTGTYTSDHEVGIFDGEGFTPSEVTDVLVVKAQPESLFVAFSLIGANAHTCGYAGTLGREGDLWVERERLPYHDGNPMCTLSLAITADTLTLRDSANVCRLHYCGARAAIDGTPFARSTWSPDTTAYEDF